MGMTWTQYNPADDHTEPPTATVVIHRYSLMNYSVTITHSPTEHARVPGRVPPLNPSYTLTGRWATKRGALRSAKRYLNASRPQKVRETVCPQHQPDRSTS